MCSHFKVILITGLLLLNACGQDKVSSKLKITNGARLSENTTGVVSLLKNDEHWGMISYCSGVLISPKHVLTAAHCSQNKEQQIYTPDTRWVSIGSTSPESDVLSRVKVSKITVMDNFDPGQLFITDSEGLSPKTANDVAIWELSQTVDSVKPHSLLSFKSREDFFKQNHLFTIMGFGLSSIWQPPGAPAKLRSAVTPYHEFSTITKVEEVESKDEIYKRK